MLQYQDNNLIKLKENICKKNELLIVGTPNSGRKFVVEQWSKDIEKSIIIKLESTNSNREYVALLTALNKFDCKKQKSIKLTPSISGKIFDLSIEEENLFDVEEKIKKFLLKLVKKHVVIFLYDKSSYTKDESYNLVDSFIKECKEKYRKRIYKIILSEKKEQNLPCVYFENLSHCNSNKYEVLKKLGLNPDINLSDKVIEFIFANISNNIKLLIEIIKDINSNSLDYNFQEYDVNNQTDALIGEVLKNYQYKKQIDDLLSICAIADHYFKSVDLAFLLKENEPIIKLLLEFAQKHYLLENNNSSYQIIFGLVRKIYSSLDEINKNKIYTNIVTMFTNIYPSDYYNKYFFAKLANLSEAKVYLIQHIFYQIRMNYDLTISDYEQQLSKKEYAIIQIYNQAFGHIKSKRYNECTKILEPLIDLSGELLYEINILKSQCLIKSIDELDRQKALTYLQYDEKNVDENLKFRLDIRKIASYVHVGEYKNAIVTCEIVKERLLQMHLQTNALEYEYYINIIYRKHSYVCEYDMSINYVKKSVDFFRKHKKIYFNSYYIALINLFSLYIVNMHLEKALEIKQEIEQLLLSKNNINFPRREILENNIILYNYFSKEKELEDVIYAFKKLYEETYDIADHILIASNYAVFLMLSNNFEEARKILLKEVPNVDNDLEGIYNYRIKINLSICEFLMNNENRNHCVRRLETVEYNKEDPHYRVRSKELNDIIKLMKDVEQCNDTKKWCEEYKNNVLTALNTHTTYQQGLIFTTLFNWDDD